VSSLPDPTESLGWLAELGISDLRDLNPCVPGEFTVPQSYYVNTATPHVVYRGTEEGTLPMVSGRWFLIPGTITARVPKVIENTVPVARAVRLTREL
jgi:hypothetical protein